MKIISYLSVTALLLVAGCWQHLHAQQRRPNVIVFLVDDMGWQDTSVPFWQEKTPLNNRYHTPAMERMAREGRKFTNAYATPVCTPTRISLMTGMNAARHHVTLWTSPTKDRPTDSPDSTLAAPDWNYNGLDPARPAPHSIHATALPQLLAAAGYYTIHCGKGHFGSRNTTGADPKQLGFRVNIAGHAAGHPGSYLPEKNYGNHGPAASNTHGVPGLEKYHGSDVFLTEALTREALLAIDTAVSTGKPFFLYMSHYAVHMPLEADPRFFNQYLQEGLDSTEASYASLIAGMDKSLGDILQYLDDHQLSKETLILFMSDNGGLSLTPARTGPAHTQNLPLKAGKGSVYEGGIREPMIAKWPGVIQPGTTSDQYLIIEDFFPTILQVAGINKPQTVQQVDGVSFLPLLKGRAAKNNTRPLIWHVPNKWIDKDGPGINWHSAIRLDNWKLICNQRLGKLELYDLAKDIGEHHNVAAQYPAVTQKLALLLTKELKARNAQMPVNKTDHKTLPWPDHFITR